MHHRYKVIQNWVFLQVYPDAGATGVSGLSGIKAERDFVQTNGIEANVFRVC